MNSSPLHNYAFLNQQNNLFKNKATELGFVEAEFSNGAAYGDLDNDGDLDLVINNVNMPASVYQNTASKKGNHFISIDLKDEQSQNQLAIGATVSVKTMDRTYSQQHYVARGFQSSVTSQLLFGLNTTTAVESVEVIWPDKTVQVINNPPIDQSLTITKNTNRKVRTKEIAEANYLLKSKKAILGNSAHKESNFNDFDFERLLPRMYSTEGPKIETGDLNGDGHTDFIVLGATGDVDKVFLQNAEGKFERKILVKVWRVFY